MNISLYLSSYNKLIINQGIITVKPIKKIFNTFLISPKIILSGNVLFIQCFNEIYTKIIGNAKSAGCLYKYPNAINKATDKIMPMIENFKEAINKIDKEIVKKWVDDLVIDKTFIGLKFQEAILKRIAKMKNKSYRLSTPQEESKGVDGFIGELPVSIKPITYKIKDMLNEQIEVKIIFYEKKKDGINVDASQLD